MFSAAISRELSGFLIGKMRKLPIVNRAIPLISKEVLCFSVPSIPVAP